MADSEKLTALKKAYADIILNTAKEAAARIMVSERKALQYQQELFAAKDESLRMLLRLKQMLDSKVTEAEMTSLSQQRRIEELEAQLGEAEDIVKDLRAELRELQEELEKVSYNQMQLFNEQNSKPENGAAVETLVEDRLDTFQTVIHPPADAQPELVTTSDMTNSILKGTYDFNLCTHRDNCYACNSDFPSIIMRHKEPDLYRNGCTQRIRALERSLLNGNLSLFGKEDDIKNESSSREVDEGKDACEDLSAKADIYREAGNPDEFKMMQADENCTQVHAVKTPHRKRKKATKYRKHKAPSSKEFPDQIEDMCRASDFSDTTPFEYAINNNAEDKEDSQMIENNCQNGPESPLTLKSSSGTIKTSIEDFKRHAGAEFIKACSVQKNQKLLIDKRELKQESESAENLEVAASNIDLEAVDLSSVNSEVNVSNLTERVPAEPVKNKFLKYTFTRKRKKESLSSSDRDSSLDESTIKCKTGEKQNGSLDSHSQKSSLITESSRDSRRLAQVARQLISLSEKKWWQ